MFVETIFDQCIIECAIKHALFTTGFCHVFKCIHLKIDCHKDHRAGQRSIS